MRLGLAKVAVNVDFVVGDEVKIMTGALESFTGKIIAMNDATQKLKVKVEMFGRATDVELDYVQVKKINSAPVEPEKVEEVVEENN
jgi:transcriptional antiterminator NusG